MPRKNGAHLNRPIPCFYDGDQVASRGVAAVLNAVLWGSGYIYSRRGASGVLAALTQLTLYGWSYFLGIAGVVLWGPILTLGSLYFAIDGYKYGSSSTGPGQKEKAREPGKRGFCSSCGACLSPNAKFCSECGARQGS